MKFNKIALTLLCGSFPFLAEAGHTRIEATFTNSEIYPETSHSIIVTVPDQYDGKKTAALYLGLDGILCNAPEVIDSLSASGIIPTTIGVYLQPGVVKDSDGNIIRYNRSNEFDATDDRFATFLEKELLPYIENLTTQDGRAIKFTDNPADRMIFGLSSGGIAAFVTAWHRPDLFGKIFSGCGTFVPMRGGQNLQAIVRKHEPKPIKICLQDGFSDTWNPIFGSWFEANAMLGTALEFAGYDCMFDWQEGVHSVRRATEIFPDVMTWMWSKTPDSIIGKTKNNYLAPLLENAGDWKGHEKPADVAVVPLSLPDGITCPTYAFYPDNKHVAVSMPETNFIWQYLVDRNGKLYAGERFYWLHDYDNTTLKIGSMMFDGDGYLWVVTNAGIQICDQNGRVRGILDMPRDLNPAETQILVSDGMVTISDGSKSFSRLLNVKAAIEGKSPESQGAA